MDFFILALWTHALMSLFMTGLIWLIQTVHYPAFHFIADNHFSKFHHQHSFRITFVVFPPMLLELLSAIYLIAVSTDLVFISILLLTSLIWLSTIFIQVPVHNKLPEARFEHRRTLINKLIATNWIRTIAWTVKSSIIIYLLFKVTV